MQIRATHRRKAAARRAASISGLVAALALLVPLPASAEDEPPAWQQWLDERFQVHGFLVSNLYVRSPDLDLSRDAKVSSWRTELNLETELSLYREASTRVGLYGVFRPLYEANQELHGNRFGDDAHGGAFDPVTLGAMNASRAIRGKKFPGHGACIQGEFCLANGDVGSLFSGEKEAGITIDDVVFFGAVTAPVWTRSRQGRVGGNADGETYLDYLNSSLREISGEERLTTAISDRLGLPENIARLLAQGFVSSGTAGLEASLTPVGQVTGDGLPGRATRDLRTPLNYRQGAIGDTSSFQQAPFDINARENELRFDCLDNAHDWCFVRELYLDVEWEDTFVRVGRQQIVWGKTDAFRLQDVVNPVDLGYHNVFPDLEERRIPQLGIDVVQGLPDVGPLQDLSFELAWVIDKWKPLQFGQCGEAYAYAIACQARADAGAHQLFNFALAKVKERKWRIENTEVGARVEFRTPEPSISFSLSAFYGFQDLPVAEFRNHYSAQNPNPAGLLFLQGLGVGGLIENFGGAAPGSSPWSTGFDPYNDDPDPGDPTNRTTLEQANDLALAAWQNAFTALPQAAGGCADAPPDQLGACANGLLPLALPWTASEAVLVNPRIWTLGASADYQVPDWDTILRIEVAADLDRSINNTNKRDGVDKSPVFLASVGIDRPTYIPFLNPNRTAFLTVQQFFEHIVDYDGKGPGGAGMVQTETNYITTFLMENFWRNDSIRLRTFVAHDWKSQATLFGPALRWTVNQNVFLEGGINLLWGGESRPHNIRNLCADGSLGCIGDPSTWQQGQWQTLNANLQRTAQSPFFARQGFADRFMERRDEFWVGMTYQF